MELLDTCRGSWFKSLFPGLVAVQPQPDARWAVCLMIPAWAQERVMVCLDLTLVDGRIFASDAPPVTDLFSLLNLAGFAGGAAIEVYIAGSSDPIDAGADIRLETGTCITYVPAGNPREYASDLAAMLRTHLGWAPGPPFPVQAGDQRICAVADGWHCDFPLRPERVFTDRADLAARFGLNHSRLVLSPALERPLDVCLYGRPCETVVGVGESYRRSPDPDLIVGLIDCRPLLEGWVRAIAVDGWIDLASIRSGLMQGPDFESPLSAALLTGTGWLLRTGKSLWPCWRPIPPLPLCRLVVTTGLPPMILMTLMNVIVLGMPAQGAGALPGAAHTLVAGGSGL